jgi:recombination protein RecA
MSQALRKLAGAINKSNTCAIFINQLREKVGVIYGSPEVTTGGRALKFYASMRIDVRKVETIKSGDLMLGNRTRAKIVKNKVAPPFKQAEFDIMYGEGISKVGDLLDFATASGIVNKAGSWYSYSGDRIGQGRENAKGFLTEHPDIASKIETQVFDRLKQERESSSKTAGPEGPAPGQGLADEIVRVDEDGVVIEDL